jgi:hypothetical protein
MKKIEVEGFKTTGDDERYLTPNDVNMRVAHTVCQFDGTPVYVDGQYEGFWIQCRPLASGEHWLVHANDRRFAAHGLRVGFMNWGADAIYLARNPLRSQRQGLDFPRLDQYSLKKGQHIGLHIDGEIEQALFQMFSANYLTIDQAIKRLSRGSYAEAFSKTWALKNLPSKRYAMLYHKTEGVALFNLTAPKIKFKPGELTELRRRSLVNILSKNGANYDISETL